MPSSSSESTPWPAARFVAVDVETTGLDSERDRVIELAWVVFEDGMVVDTASYLVNPGCPIPGAVRRLTGITDGLVENAPALEQVLPRLAAALDDAAFVVAYNAGFDRGFLANEAQRARTSLPPVPWVDPLMLLRHVEPRPNRFSLSEAAARWGLRLSRGHRALPDAETAGQLLLCVAPFIPADDVRALLVLQRRWQQESAREREARRA